jgi:polyisoprenoid-binding protein YceI
MTVLNQSVVHYSIDTRVSQFTVQAFASGLISAVAHSPRIAIRDWSGEAYFVPGSLQNATLAVKINAASLEVLDELRDQDRREIQRVMNNEVLETARFRDVLFESSAIHSEQLKADLYRVSVDGRLSLHGVTNSHSFLGQVAFGVDTLRTYGEFTLLQSDYSIRIASIAGATLKLQDELKFTFYVIARKQS